MFHIFAGKPIRARCWEEARRLRSYGNVRRWHTERSCPDEETCSTISEHGVSCTATYRALRRKSVLFSVFVSRCEAMENGPLAGAIITKCDRLHNMMTSNSERFDGTRYRPLATDPSKGRTGEFVDIGMGKKEGLVIGDEGEI